MKKYLLLIIAVVAFLLFFNILSQHKSKTELKHVAIATHMSHPALDAVQQNLIKELENQGFVEGDNIRYIFRNANDQIQLGAIIASELASLDLDLIIAITTPMSQAITKKARCPVVFAAVTDPVGAGLVQSIETGEEMITGTSDAWPYEDQLELIRRISPYVKTIGVLYNPGEAASQYGIKQIRRLAPDLGFDLIEGAVSTTGEVYPVALNLVNRVDALYLSSDNTVIAGVAAAVKVAVDNQKPLFVGDSGTVKKGGMATVSVGYPELGIETGKIAARMLRGERHIPTLLCRGSDIYINLKAAELMGVDIPADILENATEVYEEIF